ncbi:hypothetical protein GCM10012275_29390 [Longimycelium tulufanense]|uniref:MFS transporter n=1 Tax=Longimycelium tulufanense TaxID=907463 RepID=A0A8J3FU83_9PSEU|nr:hypothetical protein [Longimycelium tulufanense]GGM56382.1 hypothetical protein GCM10012275_29390 [Longimycelium tulufanense]
MPLLASCALIAGVAEGPTLPALIRTRQRYTPGRLLAQVSTTGAGLKIGAATLGSATGGFLVPVWGSGPVLILVAIAQVAAAAVGWVVMRARAYPPSAPTIAE